MFSTIEAIVDDLDAALSEEDRAYIKSLTLKQAGGLHHGYGTYIRNHYGLWHDNPLTEKWRTDESSHDIRDGVDYSADHPDQMSSTIIDALWHKLQK